GIRGTDGDQAPISRDPPNFPQPPDGIREGELLARHPADETSAADLAARLETPVDAGELTPGSRIGLAREQTPEDDAIAAQQRPRLNLDRLVVRHLLTSTGCDRRPAAGAVAAPVVPRRTAARGP